MNKNIIVFLLIFLSLSLSAQTFTDSNLPIVVIETDGGVTIPDEPKVLATMKIIWHQDGSRNYLTDIDNPEFLNYDGRIGIERRGSSSQMYSNKKPYGLTTLQDDNVTNNNVSILGMPAENDWILNSLAFDQTGMRDVVAYELSEAIGQYASRRVYCEVVINGDYRGLYVFMEKIKVDKNRVDIERMDETCNQPPEVTGGYITKADRSDNDPLAWTMQTYQFGWGGYVNTEFIHHYPKPEDITSAQHNYIHGVFNDLADASHSYNTSIQHIQRYQSAVMTKGRQLIREYDAKYAETGDLKLLTEANEKLADMAKEQSTAVLGRVLYEASVTMKNGYNRADN